MAKLSMFVIVIEFSLPEPHTEMIFVPRHAKPLGGHRNARCPCVRPFVRPSQSLLAR